MMVTIILAGIFCTQFGLTASIDTSDGDLSHDSLYASKLMEKYGTDGSLSLDQLKHLMEQLEPGKTEDDHGVTNGHDTSGSRPPSVDNGGVDCENETESTGLECMEKTCLAAENIFASQNIEPDSSADVRQLYDMAPAILFQAQNHDCYELPLDHNSLHNSTRPDLSAVIGYSFLCVTCINLCALLGMIFLPLMKKSFYHRLLMFLVALAVGTLSGSSILFLIPESLHMSDQPGELADLYIWLGTTIIGGIYLFFLVERMLKLIMACRRPPEINDYFLQMRLYKGNSKIPNLSELPPSSVKTREVHISESGHMSFDVPPTSSGFHDSNSSQALVPVTPDVAQTPMNTEVMEQIGYKEIKPVAWMVIFGDGLHNFIDGLSIGAAFTESIMTGLSVSLAVVCEELPHELGDFAILLNSGMTPKQALGYNFLSACMCYIGLAIGIALGELTSGARWIFALAAGMFLYISLVDMFPEVNHAAEEEEKEHGRLLPAFLIQNAGLLTGIGSMVLLAHYGQYIDLTS